MAAASMPGDFMAEDFTAQGFMAEAFMPFTPLPEWDAVTARVTPRYAPKSTLRAAAMRTFLKARSQTVTLSQAA